MASGSKPNHDYHILEPSPWPLVGSVGALVMAVGAVALMRWNKGDVLMVAGTDIGGWGIFAVGLAIVLGTMAGWWADTVKESLHGDHTPIVKLHLRYGMILFIASEVMFFVAWFWAYFDVALFPDELRFPLRVEETGGMWPPVSIETFDPWHLPLFNTMILLLSGTTVTWAHHALLENDKEGLRLGLLCTVALGALFSLVQIFEYTHAAFAFDGNIYGATFFMATGFHGFHVFVGTIFLAICLWRASKNHFTPQRHFGFEAAAWYWHFVDVVWLFLFLAIYVWGAGTIAH
ncbi:cytochrome c oxidase subunit 3 [Acuticoccus sp. MNP-M23]|uniref:cytochrome c oxidase subunit 3 n=1 Tax=Acuticoccus sp. MNP-M23 TaxID=3072793 RepID=UPI002814F9E1|nr:cytochrome c oxidase subunit 3 [Acuticoccus sp. MNP-M23]WMS43867.1 cytochrome c oxidase subunit 3 [Acuticoccus sp. MNP-M23]